MSAIRKLWLNLTTCRAPSDHRNSYSHWYCQKRRWHTLHIPRTLHVSQAKVHRFNNYVWVDGQYPVYAPLPIDVAFGGSRRSLAPRKRRSADLATPYTEQETTNG